VTLHLKASKTDPFREGVDIHLFSSGASVCPVISLERYVEFRNKTFERNNDKEPFFVMENGKALTRHYFIYSLKRILTSLGNSLQRRKPKYAITHVASKSISVTNIPQ
jgi:hypothetical protein